MKNYMTIKFVKAEQMNRLEYNNYRGWTVPKDENPMDEGYVVYHADGHTNWFPKNIFEGSHIEVIDNPKFRLSR